MASLKTVQYDKATCNVVCSRLLELNRSQRMINGEHVKCSSSPIRAASLRRKMDQYRFHCYNGNTLGHIALSFKVERKERVDDNHQKIRINTLTKDIQNQGLSWIQGPANILQMNWNIFPQLKNISCTCTPRRQYVSIYQDARNGDTEPKWLSQAYGEHCVFGYVLPSDCEGLYTLQAQVDYDKQSNLWATFVSEKVSGAGLWHRRLSRIGLDTVCRMAEKQVVGIALNISSPTIHCDTCPEEKPPKRLTTGRLITCDEYHTVHSKVIGPIQPLRIGKSRYIVPFIVERPMFAKVCAISRTSKVRGCLK